MNEAQAIKDRKTLNELLDVYEPYSKEQILLEYCLYTGLRISDVLSAKVGESLAGVRRLKEQKTGKSKTIKLNNKLVNSISVYASNNNLSDDDYLFFSSRNRDEHIKRSRASKIIAKAGDMIDITCSAHSLRKTFGYLAYKNGTSIELLMQIFNHSSQSVTLRYIGITQENINEVYDSINISF